MRGSDWNGCWHSTGGQHPRLRSLDPQDPIRKSICPKGFGSATASLNHITLLGRDPNLRWGFSGRPLSQASSARTAARNMALSWCSALFQRGFILSKDIMWAWRHPILNHCDELSTRVGNSEGSMDACTSLGAKWVRYQDLKNCCMHAGCNTPSWLFSVLVGKLVAHECFFHNIWWMSMIGLRMFSGCHWLWDQETTRHDCYSNLSGITASKCQASIYTHHMAMARAFAAPVARTLGSSPGEVQPLTGRGYKQVGGKNDEDRLLVGKKSTNDG